MDRKEFGVIWQRARLAMETEKEYKNMTHDRMVDVLFDLLACQLFMYAQIVEADGPTEHINRSRDYVIALRKAVEPYEAEYMARMQEKEGEA